MRRGGGGRRGRRGGRVRHRLTNRELPEVGRRVEDLVGVARHDHRRRALDQVDLGVAAERVEFELEDAAGQVDVAIVDQGKLGHDHRRDRVGPHVRRAVGRCVGVADARQGRHPAADDLGDDPAGVVREVIDEVQHAVGDGRALEGSLTVKGHDGRVAVGRLVGEPPVGDGDAVAVGIDVLELDDQPREVLVVDRGPVDQLSAGIQEPSVFQTLKHRPRPAPFPPGRAHGGVPPVPRRISSGPRPVAAALAEGAGPVTQDQIGKFGHPA